MKDLNNILRKKKMFERFNILIWFVNIALLVLSFLHFYSNNYKLELDTYFFLLLVLNIVSFYLTYIISEKLHFFKYQYNHFKNLKETEI